MFKSPEDTSENLSIFVNKTLNAEDEDFLLIESKIKYYKNCILDLIKPGKS